MDGDFKRPHRPYADMVIEQRRARSQVVPSVTITPEKHRLNGKKLPKLAISLSVVAIFILVLTGFIFFVMRSHSSFIVLPSRLTARLDFPIYYPQIDKLPTGYKYEDGSASVEAGMLFFRLIDDKGKRIFLSEQTTPGRDIGVDKLADFSPFETPVGTAYGGKQKSGAAAIISTPKTLITINGSSDVPQDIVNSAAKSLALPK